MQPAMHVQFSDLTNAKDLKGQRLSAKNLLQYLIDERRSAYFREMAIVVARIIALTPHSADVERCISANNQLKSDKRTCLSVETENKYLYVRFNIRF